MEVQVNYVSHQEAMKNIDSIKSILNENNFLETTIDGGNDNYFLMYFQNELIGFAIVEILNIRCYIYSFCILKKYQSKGLGRAFLNSILNLVKSKLKTVGVLNFQVNLDSEENNVEFYEKCGFKSSGEFLNNGINIHLMYTNVFS